MKRQKEKLLMKMVSISSIGVACISIILKWITFLMTGSVAMLSTLFDSIQDFLTSLVNFIAVRTSLVPADKSHRFGHGKAQAIGALIQAFIIFMSSVFLFIESVKRLLSQEPIDQIEQGIVVLLVIIFLTEALILFQNYVVKVTGSLSIRADRAHYSGDILMNIGVIISMLGAFYLKWYFIDALFGVGVSIYLASIVYHIVKESFEILMDKEMPFEFREELKKHILSFKEVLDIQDLKTRMSGEHIFVQFNIKLSSHLTLEEAHSITDRLEIYLKDIYPDIQVMVHPEPFLKEHTDGCSRDSY